MRRDATTESAKEHWTQAANDHKQGIFRDRSVGRRYMYLSESCTAAGSVYSPEHGLLYVSIDGMDQALRSKLC